MGDTLQENLASGNRKLEMVASRTGMLPSSLAWITKVSDPWHDVEVPCTGLPDAFTGKSIVREMTETYTVSQSDFGLSLADGETWNLNIGIMPLMSYQQIQRGVFVAQRGLLKTGDTNVYDEVLGQFGICGYRGNSADADNYPWPTNLGTGEWQPGDVAGVKAYKTTSPWENVYGFPSDQNPTAVRCIGAAFEVLDTTNQFYQQGLVTTYRLNTEFDQVPHDTLGTFVPSSTSAEYSAYRSYVFPTPANYSAEVQNLPGTQQWAAREGCYVTGVMDLANIADFAHYTDQKGFVGYNTLVPDGTGVQSVMCLSNKNAWKAPGIHDETPAVYLNKPFLPTATQTAGAIFEGLNRQAVLQIRVRGVYETVPDQSQADIRLGINNSPPNDPEALEVYAEAIKNFPTGVPFNQNPLGEWFDMVCSFIAGVAAPIGSAFSTAFLGDPTSGAAIGGGVAGAAKWAAALNASYRK